MAGKPRDPLDVACRAKRLASHRQDGERPESARRRMPRRLREGVGQTRPKVALDEKTERFETALPVRGESHIMPSPA